jgi:hypothetical protein
MCEHCLSFSTSLDSRCLYVFLPFYLTNSSPNHFCRSFQPNPIYQKHQEDYVVDENGFRGQA